MTESSPFALRMPSTLKSAAKALSKTSFYEWDEEAGRTRRGVAPRSINEALIYLMTRGAGQALKELERDLVSATKDHVALQEVVKFFMNNPAAEHALPVNFPEKSPSREFLDVWSNDGRLQSEDDPTSSGPVDGITRTDALDEFAVAQRVMAGRVAAKGALQKVVGLT